MIKYTNEVDNLSEACLEGFFVGWPNPPSPQKHKEILLKSDYVWLAIDEDTNHVVGFMTALSDQILSAYIPLLEVLPNYQGQGIGSQLTQLMFKDLEHLYMIDLLCDEDIMPFYDHLNMFRAKGMCLRNYHRQNAQ